MIILERNNWYGVVSSPVGAWPWAASPFRLQVIEPLKTGQGLIRLRGVAVFQPSAPLVVDATFQILKRDDKHMILSADEEQEQLVIALEPMSDGWLRQYWPEMLERTFYGSSYDMDGPTDRLSLAYYSSEEVIEHGVMPTSFRVDSHAMPKQAVTLEYRRRFQQLDSCLLSRGILPREMEDKWFVYLDDGALVFKRSWTGYVIYVVTLIRVDGDLEARSVIINRDPRQYSSTDDLDDLRQLDLLIDHLLLGKVPEF